jgi:hypothetical protein
MSDSGDIVRELNDWLAHGESHRWLDASDVDLVRRAIAEINSLREKLGERQATESFEVEELNASND